MSGFMRRLVITILIVGGCLALAESRNNSSEKGKEEIKCMNSSASDFPEDFFSEEERKHGAIIVHLIVAFYCFTLIAVVCNDYFLPSVDCIITDLNLSQDVAGATFMAIATSTPELFINIIGTFITESDLGVGTVVGSAVFNTLGVASCLGLAACKVIQLEWWPLTRDCSIYMIAIGVLTAITYDEKVEWYEAMVLMLMYVMYFIIMFANGYLMKVAKKLVAKVHGSTTVLNDAADAPSEVCSSVGPGIYRWYLHGDITTNIKTSNDVEKCQKKEKELNEKEENDSLCPPPEEIMWKAWKVFKWPISFILSITIPDSRKDHLRSYYPLSFIMCIIWIGTSSYMNAWMMSVIGSTIGVPDSVMGLTVLAAGGCLPEAFSSIIMAKKGVGALGISNSVGANTLDILLCLGLPWLIKCIITIAETGDMTDGYVQILSQGVTYNCFALLLCVFILYMIISSFHFQLDKRLGFTCLVIYLFFITMAVLSEMNMFFHVNDPLC